MSKDLEGWWHTFLEGVASHICRWLPVPEAHESRHWSFKKRDHLAWYKMSYGGHSPRRDMVRWCVQWSGSHHLQSLNLPMKNSEYVQKFVIFCGFSHFQVKYSSIPDTSCIRVSCRRNLHRVNDLLLMYRRGVKMWFLRDGGPPENSNELQNFN